jgi:hexulose-6-phosphate isomerase
VVKPGVTQIVVADKTTPQFIDSAADAGYECVELAIRADGDLTLATPHDQLQAYADHAKSRNIELVSMAMLHCTGNLLDGGDEQARSLDETLAALHMAKTLGIACTLHTLGRLRADLYYDDAYRNAVTSLKRLAPHAEQLGIDIALEFVWNGFLFSPLEMRGLLDEVASPRIGFYFDPGNMAVYQFPHHWVRVCRRHIKMVHLKDWKGGALNGAWPALTEGEIDYAAMNAELRSAGYDGPMISEVPPQVASLEKTADAIRRIIAM